MKRRIKRILAYVGMPFIFATFGYFIMEVYQPLSISDNSNNLLNQKSNHKQIENQRNNKQITTNSSFTDKISIKEIEFPEQGTHFANLSCNEISLDAPLFWGDTDEILNEGVGQSIGSFLPGIGKTILISGHNTTYFKPLQNMKKGDIISCNTNYGSYEYQVYDIQVINENEALKKLDEWLSYEDETLILYTCYPFKLARNRKEERLFVFARP
jgi:sortase A